MNFEFDQYFTPPLVAERVFGLAGVVGKSLVCVDTTCGTGNLLDAATNVYASKTCIGIDKDHRVISKLKKTRPHWHLAPGDIFDQHLHKDSLLQGVPESVDLLVLNPPFSQSSNKSTEIEYRGEMLRGSLAMACLLRSLEIFQPQQGAILIAPESMFFSNVDEAGRKILLQEFSVREILALSNSTFHGARVNSFAVRITPGSVPPRIKPIEGSIQIRGVRLVRGGLQVHSLREDPEGVPFVHSTAIRQLITERCSFLELPKTSWGGSGRVRGWCLLLPRVGIPNYSYIRAVYLKREVQLSDCVIAIQCHNKQIAADVEVRILDAWTSLRELYRGTGARYVTLSRLREWLTNLGVQPS